MLDVRVKIGIIGTEVRTRYADGSPIRWNVKNARPKRLVHSFDPYVAEEYGRLTNRAPIVTGKLAVVGIVAALPLDEQDRSVDSPKLVVEAGQYMYGFDINGAVLDGIAAAVGHPEFKFVM